MQAGLLINGKQSNITHQVGQENPLKETLSHVVNPDQTKTLPQAQNIFYPSPIILPLTA